ncbi:MAG TPA: hypothetical protein VGI81_12220 [Tepidisphaeraceae bacterium]|jgi:hypothetical protein
MGLDLRVSTDSDEVEIRLGRGETEAIKLLRASLPAEADAVFGVEDFGKPSTITGEAFLAAATALLKAVESSGEEAGRMYYLQMEDSPGRWGTASGITAGINGKRYTFRAGRNCCTMEPCVRWENGQLVYSEKTDIRSLTSIQTDHGEIRIIWKPVNHALRPHLRNLVRFAETHRNAMLEKILG